MKKRMEPHYHYSTISEAIDDLRRKGYHVDFNLEENFTYGKKVGLNSGEYKIREVYRYEGNSDPADEATVTASNPATASKESL